MFVQLGLAYFETKELNAWLLAGLSLVVHLEY
jgi:hypothetical protein